MGRRARPVELLVLNGKKHLTKKEVMERQEAEASLRPKADAIRPPRWLSKAARKEWRRIVKVLDGLGILTNADVDTLAVYCDAVVRYAEASKIIETEGMVVQTERGSKQHPAVLAQQKYAGIMARCAAQLGLEPSARAALAVKLAKDAGPKDRFEELFGS